MQRVKKSVEVEPSRRFIELHCVGQAEVVGIFELAAQLDGSHEVLYGSDKVSSRDLGLGLG